MGRRGLARGLLVYAIVLALAGVAVLGARTRHQTVLGDPIPRYLNALARGDYATAYSYTDLDGFKLTGLSSGITSAHYTAFERAHAIRTWQRLSGNEVELTYRNGRRARATIAVEETTIVVPVSTLVITAPTGPLPSIAIDGVPTPARAAANSATAAGTISYRYAIAVIRGVHHFSIGRGPVTAGRALVVNAAKPTVDARITLTISDEGSRRSAIALHSIVGTCPGETCVVAPCTGSGTDYVLDASGIGTPFIIARALIGDRVLAPMPAGGWAIAVTFDDLAQPPGLSGKEQTKTVRARYVFGFRRGHKPALLDRCWLPNR